MAGGSFLAGRRSDEDTRKQASFFKNKIHEEITL
jgi:hypothetical protein